MVAQFLNLALESRAVVNPIATGAPEAFEPSEQAFDLVAFLVELAIVFLRCEAIALWGHYRGHTQFQDELARLVAFI